MKTENTLENKRRFLALYLGQEVLFATDIRYNTTYSYGFVDSNIDTEFIKYHLLLKPLSKINQPHAKEIGHQSDKDSIVHFADVLYTYESDFLRSKGYAVPYMDLSVKDLIDYKWIKIEENE